MGRTAPFPAGLAFIEGSSDQAEGEGEPPRPPLRQQAKYGIDRTFRCLMDLADGLVHEAYFS